MAPFAAAAMCASCKFSPGDLAHCISQLRLEHICGLHWLRISPLQPGDQSRHAPR